VCSNGVGTSTQPTSRRVQLRANCKMELMKQQVEQVEQEKMRRRSGKALSGDMPFTSHSPAFESPPLAEYRVKVCDLLQFSNVCYAFLQKDI